MVALSAALNPPEDFHVVGSLNWARAFFNDRLVKLRETTEGTASPRSIPALRPGPARMNLETDLWQ